jgi:hypothetical protein
MTSGWAARTGAVALLALLAACSPPDRTYVEHGPTGTSFAIPGGWELADLQPDGSNPYEVDDALMLLRAFGPAGGELTDFPSGSEPTGLVRVTSLTGEQQENASLKTLRNSLYDIDAIREDDPNAVKVVDEYTLATEEGYHGERIVASLRIPVQEGSPPVTITIDQTALLDPFAQTQYVFAIACAAECYQTNQATIDEIVRSWKVMPA